MTDKMRVSIGTDKYLWIHKTQAARVSVAGKSKRRIMSDIKKVGGIKTYAVYFCTWFRADSGKLG